MAAKRRILLLVETDFDAVKDALEAYHRNSQVALDERLATDGICVFGHGELIRRLRLELGDDNGIRMKSICFGSVGCDLISAKERIALFGEKDLEVAKGRLSPYRCGSYGLLKKMLEANRTIVYGLPDLVAKSVSVLVNSAPT